MDEAFHAFDRPDVPLDRVHCVALEVRGDEGHDGAPSPVDAFASLMRECAVFHARELPSSALSWSVHAPMRLPLRLLGRGPAAEAGEEGANAVYDLAKAAVLAAAAGGSDVPFPEAVATSGAAADASETITLPTHVVFCCFLRWGQERVTTYVPAAGAGSSSECAASHLAKYYVFGAAGPVAAKAGVSVEEFLSDIAQAGGSRASFLGRVLLSDVAGALTAARLLPSLPAAGGLRVRSHPLLLPPPPAQEVFVGLGFGVVTIEAWLHSEVPGCACVTYHEALGHGSNLPHPRLGGADDDDARRCVMGASQHRKLPLAAPTVVICEQLKARMRRRTPKPEDARPPDRWDLRVQLSAAATEVDLLRSCLPLLAGRSPAAESSTALVWPAWSWGQAGLGGDKTMLRRLSPLSIARDAACELCGAQIVEVAAGQAVERAAAAAEADAGGCAAAPGDIEAFLSASAVLGAPVRAAACISAAASACAARLVAGAEAERDGSAARERAAGEASRRSAAAAAAEGGVVAIDGDTEGVAGAAWHETSVTAIAAKGAAAGSSVDVSANDVYKFREIRVRSREGARLNSAEGSDADNVFSRYCPACLSGRSAVVGDDSGDFASKIALLDAERNIAIELPLFGRTARLSCDGLAGRWAAWQSGAWIG